MGTSIYSKYFTRPYIDTGPLRRCVETFFSWRLMILEPRHPSDRCRSEVYFGRNGSAICHCISAILVALADSARHLAISRVSLVRPKIQPFGSSDLKATDGIGIGKSRHIRLRGSRNALSTRLRAAPQLRAIWRIRRAAAAAAAGAPTGAANVCELWRNERRTVSIATYGDVRPTAGATDSRTSGCRAV